MSSNVVEPDPREDTGVVLDEEPERMNLDALDIEETIQEQDEEQEDEEPVYETLKRNDPSWDINDIWYL